MNSPADGRNASPLMDKRGAPIPKKANRTKKGHHGYKRNPKQQDPIVVVESHSKFINAKQKENAAARKS